MRKLVLFGLIFFSTFFLSFKNYDEISKNSSSDFHNKTFELKHFIKNGVEVALDLTHPYANNPPQTRNTPFVEFTFNGETDILEAQLSGYCNGTSVKYTIVNNELLVLERGGTTLQDCGGDEETEFFSPLSGNIYLQQPANNLKYEFTENNNKLTIWSDENHKLVFEQKVLSVEENRLENAIAIYPNPTKEIIKIDLKSNEINLSEISIIDNQGKEILKQTNNLQTIDISKLSSGIYFIKIKNDSNITITRKIIKE